MLDGFDAAKTEAIRVQPAIARDVLPDGNNRVVSVTVRDGSRAAIFRASLTLRCETLP